MSPPCCRTEELDGALPVWVVQNKAGEQLRITVEDIDHDSSHELGLDPGLVKDGVEAHLQALLAEHVELLGAGYTLVRREYMTAIGPVDLLCRDEQGRSWRWRSKDAVRSMASSSSAATSSCSTATAC